LIVIFFFCTTSAQKFKENYVFTVKNNSAGTSFEFPGVLFYDAKNRTKLYTADFGIKDKTKNTTEFETGSFIIISDKSFQYILYSNSENRVIIQDNIQGKNYILEDSPAMKWQLLNETKTLNGTTLHKAVTFFRGRNYTVWYTPESLVKTGPWKFDNLPGLAVEIYDESKDFIWQLKSSEHYTQPIKNPFNDYKGDPLPYKDYPKLRYALSPALEKALQQNPNNKIVEQPRNGLEIKFEWEK